MNASLFDISTTKSSRKMNGLFYDIKVESLKAILIAIESKSLKFSKLVKSFENEINFIAYDQLIAWKF